MNLLDIFQDNLSNSGLVATLISILCVGYFVKEFVFSGNTAKSKLKFPPGPKQHWLFGNFDKFPNREKGETIDTVELQLTKEFGLVYSVNFPLISGQSIVVADPELAKRLFVTLNPPKSFFYKYLEPILGSRSIVALTDTKEWAAKRKIFNTGFTPSFLKGMVFTMAEKIDPFLEALESDIRAKKPTHMLDRSQNFTSDVILAIAFGENWNGEEGEKHPARIHIDNLVGLFGELLMNPLRMLFDVKAKLLLRRHGEAVNQEMRSILDKRIADADADNANDICSLAIASMKRDGGKITEEDKCGIVDQLKTFYFAGHDTTAIAISWCIWLLSQNTEELAKVRAELEESKIWADPAVPPTFEDLQQCVYLEAVIKETLRLYPPVGGISRNGTNLKETYKGYSLAAPLVLIQIYAMHHSPLLWNEPEVFRPERFLDGSEKDLNLKFFAFSRGPRDCIGKHFAMLEAKLAVSAMTLKYNFECVNMHEEVEAKLTNVPKNGCLVRLSHRN